MIIESCGIEKDKYEIPKWIGIGIALILVGFVTGTLTIPILAEFMRIR